MTDRYTITFTPQGLAYVRQVLGARPFDEVGALVLNLEQQKAEQDRPAPSPLSLVETQDGNEQIAPAAG